MANEPKDRDESKRSEPPGGKAGASNGANPKEKQGESPDFLPEDSFLLDIGEVAPRVNAGSSGDENSEEWILVDDDLLAATANDPAASSRGSKPGAPDAEREAEAQRLLAEMKEVREGLAPMHATGDDAPHGDVVVSPTEPTAMEAANEPDPVVLATESRTGRASAGAAVATAAAAPARKVVRPTAERKSARAPRNHFARAAGWLIAASLLGGGGWYAWKNYWPREEAPQDVASNPVTKPVTTTKPPEKPSEKPAPKPDPTASLPPAPKPNDPPVAPKDPTPTPPADSGKSDPMPSIPVIQTQTVPDKAPTASDPRPPKKDPDDAAKTAKPANSTTIVIDPRQPIRPARITPGTASAKSAPTRKADTIVELKSGYTLRGRIKSMKDGKITLGVPNGEFTFLLSEVKVLDSSAPEYQSEADMRPASVVLNSGQRLRGKLLKMNTEQVVLVVERGEMVIDQADVREVSFTGRVHF